MAVAVAAYSVFSAVSELFVTAAVFYVLWRGYARNQFRGALLAIILAFETLVNVTYMAYRLAIPSDAAADGPEWLGPVGALHGILSLAMLIGLAFLGWLAAAHYKDGENFFREHKGTTWTFVGLWLVSILSGEFLFAMTYLV